MNIEPVCFIADSVRSGIDRGNSVLFLGPVDHAVSDHLGRSQNTEVVMGGCNVMYCIAIWQCYIPVTLPILSLVGNAKDPDDTQHKRHGGTLKGLAEAPNKP